jgi:hypothetical protein
VRGFPGRLITTAFILVLGSACNAYGPKPTPAQSPTPKPTILPQATVGPAASRDIDNPALTILAPSSWKTSRLPDNSVVLSPTGAGDTSSTADPFLLVLVQDSTYFRNKMNFRADLTDPVEQLAAVLVALNRSGPKFDKPIAYQGAKYPAAITRGFERDNELTIVLMNAGNDRWIYIGAQSQEALFPYYDDTVFRPATNSLTLKTP